MPDHEHTPSFERMEPLVVTAPSTDPAYEHQAPSYAQLADWWLCGQLLADPKDLLRGLLDEHKALLARAEADRD